MKIYITAMGANRSVVENQLFNASGPLTEHLIKLYLFPSVSDVNHWRQEVWSFLPKVPKLKSTSRFPEADFIYDSISAYVDQTAELMDYMIKEEDEYTPERFNDKELQSLLEFYLSWLAEVLSTSGRVHSKEVYSKLVELGF